MQKTMSKKYRKLMPKVIKNDTKMDTKIAQLSNISENGWNARNYLFYNRKRGSEHIKIQEKSIQNRCKIDAKMMPEKVMQKVWKIMPKCIQNGDQNPIKIWKYQKKLYPKIDIEIWCQKSVRRKEFERFLNHFGSISVAYGNIPAPGLRKEKTRSQDFLRIVFGMDTEGLQQKLL